MIRVQAVLKLLAGRLAGEEFATINVGGRKELVPLSELGRVPAYQGQPEATESPEPQPSQEGEIQYQRPEMPEQGLGLQLEPQDPEGGIEFESPAENPASAAQRDALAGGVERAIDENIDRRRDKRLPEGLKDPRLLRDEHRARLGQMADELVKGGDVSYVRDENDQITGRTPSINPDWFKNLDGLVTTDEARNSVKKALDGERLGARQAAVVETMLDEVQQDRVSQVPQRIAEREEAIRSRDARRIAQSLIDPDLADPDADARTATASEIFADVLESGYPRDKLKSLVEQRKGTSNPLPAVLGTLRAEGAINEQNEQQRRLVGSGGDNGRGGQNRGQAKRAPGTDAPAQGAQPADTEGDAAGVPWRPNNEPISPEQQAESERELGRLLGSPEPDSKPDQIPEPATDAGSVVSGGRQSDTNQEPALESYTEQDLADRDQAEQSAQQRKADARRREEQRAQADKERDDFTLTGSDLPADDASRQDLDRHIKSNTEANPTDGQKEAGNYRKAKINVQGLKVSIENPRGSTRSGTDPDGNAWSTKMKSDYGYVRGHRDGADGDAVDVFVGPNPDSDRVFVVDQVDQDGNFDEHKVMLGFQNKLKALSGYKANYQRGWKVGPITGMSMDQFKQWLEEGDLKKPLSDAFDKPKADSAITNADAYRKRTDDRIKAVEKADAVEAVDRILSEHSNDPDGHMEGYDRVERAAKARKRDIENPPEPGVIETPSSERAAEGAVERLTRENPGKSYRYEKRSGGFGPYFAVIDESVNPPKSKPAQDSQKRGIEVTNVSGDTFNNWKKNVPKLGMVNGWTLFDDRNIGGSFVLMNGARRAGDFATEDDARTWAKQNAPKDSGKTTQKTQKSSTKGASEPVDDQKTPDREQQAPETPIEDFGREKVGGARKDYAQSYRETLSEGDVDPGQPLSKSWPEPSYQGLIDAGVDPWVVAFARATRDSLPPKPRKKWKLAGWVKKVTDAKALVGGLMDGRIPKKVAQAEVSTGIGSLNEVNGQLELYQQLGHDKSLKGIGLISSKYTMYDGVRLDQPKEVWEIVKAARGSIFSNMPAKLASGDTQQEAIDNFKKVYDELGKNKEKAAKKVRFDIYTNVRDGEVFIAKKIGKDVVKIKGGFSEAREAREYLSDNQKSLEQTLESLKNVPSHRSETNAARVGADHRNGGDVTPQQFEDAFGFKWVEFGNYVEQGRRQHDLNRAYDALMDLSGIINVPAKALSLNGELSLAFGARGKGGKGAASAHYEPGKIAINLTKRDGAGSLAHEWFHALDNYFSRARSEKGGMMTEKPYKRGEGVRPEVVQAFSELSRAINRTRIQQRSKQLDKRRTKQYWSTEPEMAARAFESYVIEKARDAGLSNDYLANIVSEEYWQAAAELNGMFGVEGDEQAGTYPYPEAAELPEIRGGFDNLFQVIETKETEEGVALFRAGGESPQTGVDRETAQRVIGRVKAGAAASDIDIELVEDFDGMPAAIRHEALNQGYSGAQVRGVFHQGRIYLNRSALDSPREIERVIFHELYGHYGVRKVFDTATRQAMNKLYLKLGGIKGIRDLANKHNINLDNYIRGTEGAVQSGKMTREQAQSVLADELLAFIAQDSRPTIMRSLKEFIGAVKAWLRELGFLELSNVTDSEVMNLLRQARQAVDEGRVTGSGGLIFDILPEPALQGDMQVAAFAADELPRNARRVIGDDPVLAGWTMLGQNDDAFQLPVSNEKSLEGIFNELEGDAGFVVEEADELAAQLPDSRSANESWRITAPGTGSKASVFQKNDAVWVDVSAIKTGEHGKRIYNAVANYAYNNDKVFQGDPAGLSAVAQSRRLENMISSALKFGTTRHLWPHENQVKGRSDVPVPALDWRDGRDAHNLRQMLDASLAYTESFWPEIDNVRYNPRTDDFEHANGESLSNDWFNEQAQAIRGLQDARGAGAAFTGGSASLRRAVLTNTLSRSSRSEIADILAKYGQRGSERLTGPDNATLYSADSEPRQQGGVSGSVSPEGELVRNSGLKGSAAKPIATFRKVSDIKSHTDYKAAKSGDVQAAERVIRDLVRKEDFERARRRFGEGAVFVAARAEESTGKNKIPDMLANAYAAVTEGSVDTEIVQANRAYHTGAKPMERILARAQFSGPVEPGGRYVLVDDVTTMGSTLAEMANHIESAGGEVVGSVLLANASRTLTMNSQPKQIQQLERRFGNEIRDIFSIEPSALTAAEAQYLIGFRSADELRNRAVKARRERDKRLRSKGIQGQSPGVEPETLREGESNDETRPSAGFSDSDTRFSVQPDTFTLPQERKIYGIPKDAILRKLTDKMRPLKLAQLQIEKYQGRQLDERVDAYLAEEAFHGKTENDLRKLRERFIEPLTEKMAEYGINRDELDMFLWARHAPERNAQIAKINPEMPDGGSGMTDAQAEKVMTKAEKTGKLPQMKELADTVYAMLKRRRELLEANLINDELTSAWDQSYQYYVPLKGHAQDENVDGESPRPRTGKGFDIRGKESLRALGRRTQPESPILHSIKDTTEAIIRSRKNEVGNTLLSLIEQYPNPDYWDVFTAEYPEQEPRLYKTMAGEKVDMGPVSNREDYFTTKRGGKEYFIKFRDPLMLRAMKNMGPEQMSGVTKFMAAATRYLSSMNTSYNPEFMVTNATRDIQTAVVNVLAEQDLHHGRAKDKRLVKKMVQGVPIAGRAIHASLYGKELDGAAGEWQQWFEEFREDGAKTGFFDQKDVDGQARELERMMTMAQGGWKGRILKAGKLIGDVVEHANLSVENAVRLSVYRAAREQGVTRKRATNLAKNLTVNFNRKGELGQSLNAFYMFFNASVQGTMTFARAIGTLKQVDGKRRLNAAQKLGLTAAAAGYGLAMLNREFAGEDDDGENLYNKVPDWAKERNIIIMKSIWGGEPGEYVKIPLPYGYNIFHVFGTQAEAVTNGGDGVGEAAGKFGLAAVGSFVPIGLAESETALGQVSRTLTPTLGQPVVDIAWNENFWGGPIYRENRPFRTPKPQSQLVKRSTNHGFAWLAEFMNKATGGSEYRPGAVDVNPDKLNYLFEFFTGSAGAFYGRLYNAGAKKAQGIELEDREVPFKRKVVGEVNYYRDQSHFYDRRDLTNQLKKEWQSLRGKERIQFHKKHGRKIRLQGLAEDVAKQLSGLRKRRDRIEENDRLTPKQRDERLKRLEQRMERQVDRFNRAWPDD